LRGTAARVTTIEWRTPLADIDRHFMVPPLGINRVALNLFADVGAEVVSEPRFGYIVGTSLRAGVAKGLDPTGSTKIYLRIGRSF